MKRSHRLYEPVQHAVDLQRLRDLASVQTLLAVRYEPATRANGAAGLLDLSFERDGSLAVLPLALIDPAMLFEPEDDLVIWPHAVAKIVAADALDAVGGLIAPWLQAQTFGRGGHRELIRTFGGPDRVAVFERARAAGFLGAAPYARALSGCAPALYGVRFSAEKTVSVRDSDAAAAACTLLRHARDVAVDLGDPSANEFARRWHGCASFRTIADDERFDVAVGQRDCDADTQIVTQDSSNADVVCAVAGPLPLTIMVSFDERDAPAVSRFCVRVRDRSDARRARFGYPPPPVGGSAGRILIAIRKDAQEQPDADTDDAFELARRLRGEGFSVDVTSHLAPVDYAGYDLVHAFNALAVDDVVWSLEHARAAGRPTVLTPGLEDVAACGIWGMGVTNSLFSSYVDERALWTHLQGLQAHNVFTPELPPLQRHQPRPDFEDRVRELMTLADVVMVSGPAEEAFLRERFGRVGEVHVSAPYLNASEAPAAVDALVGSDEFVLAHAPIDSRCNQVMLVRALREVGLPLVLLGPVADAHYLELVREQAGDRVYFVPDATDGQIAALYGRARVYADVAWIGYGLRRIAQAGAFGCALAIANLRYGGALWRPGLWEVDPASVDSIAAGVGDAWAHAGRADGSPAGARRIAETCDPVMSLVATATAYDRAQHLRLNSIPVPAEIEG